MYKSANLGEHIARADRAIRRAEAKKAYLEETRKSRILYELSRLSNEEREQIIKILQNW